MRMSFLWIFACNRICTLRKGFASINWRWRLDLMFEGVCESSLFRFLYDVTLNKIPFPSIAPCLQHIWCFLLCGTASTCCSHKSFRNFARYIWNSNVYRRLNFFFILRNCWLIRSQGNNLMCNHNLATISWISRCTWKLEQLQLNRKKEILQWRKDDLNCFPTH